MTIEDDLAYGLAAFGGVCATTYGLYKTFIQKTPINPHPQSL